MRIALALTALGLALSIATGFLISPLLALVAGGGLVVLGTVLRSPDAATHAVLFLLYSNLPGVGVAFHGLPKPLAAAFPLLLALPLVRDLVSRREPLVLTPTFVVLLLFLAVQTAGAAFSIDPGRALASVGTFAVEGVALYLLVTNVLRTQKTLEDATTALVAAGVLMSVVPLFQQATGTFQRNYGGLAQVDGGGFTAEGESEEAGVERTQPRLAGPVGEKNRYAQVMLVLVPLSVWRLFRARTRLGRLLSLAAAGSISLGFVLAFSRGGAVGMACILGVALLLRLIDLKKALLAVGAMGLLLLALPQYWTRIASIGDTARLLDGEGGAAAADGATRRRVTEMLAAVYVFLDHPVIGVGPSMFKSYSEAYGNQNALRRIEGGRRAHSLYLEVAAETGILGLGLFLGALLLTFIGLMSVRRRWLGHDPPRADLATAYLLALVGYCSTGLFLHLSYMRYFYLLLALCGAVARVGLEPAPAARAARGAELRALPAGGRS